MHVIFVWKSTVKRTITEEVEDGWAARMLKFVVFGCTGSA